MTGQEAQGGGVDRPAGGVLGVRLPGCPPQRRREQPLVRSPVTGGVSRRLITWRVAEEPVYPGPVIALIADSIVAAQGGGEVLDPDGDHDLDRWIRRDQHPRFPDDHFFTFTGRRLLVFTGRRLLIVTRWRLTRDR